MQLEVTDWLLRAGLYAPHVVMAVSVALLLGAFVALHRAGR